MTQQHVVARAGHGPVKNLSAHITAFGGTLEIMHVSSTTRFIMVSIRWKWLFDSPSPLFPAFLDFEPKVPYMGPYKGLGRYNNLLYN